MCLDDERSRDSRQVLHQEFRNLRVCGRMELGLRMFDDVDAGPRPARGQRRDHDRQNVGESPTRLGDGYVLVPSRRSGHQIRVPAIGDDVDAHTERVPVPLANGIPQRVICGQG